MGVDTALEMALRSMRGEDEFCGNCWHYVCALVPDSLDGFCRRFCGLPVGSLEEACADFRMREARGCVWPSFNDDWLRQWPDWKHVEVRDE